MPVSGELAQLFDHHRACGHVDPQRECLGGENDSYQALGEATFDRLAERGNHPGVVCRDAMACRFGEGVVSEDVQILVGEVTRGVLDDLTYPCRLT